MLKKLILKKYKFKIFLKYKNKLTDVQAASKKNDSSAS